MPGEQTISFKDMCARFDVTPRTLRYYEYIELLNPRKEGRARFYGPREIARMTLIRRDRQLKVLDDQIADLTAARADLEALRDTAARELSDMG